MDDDDDSGPQMAENNSGEQDDHADDHDHVTLYCSVMADGSSTQTYNLVRAGSPGSSCSTTGADCD